MGELVGSVLDRLLVEQSARNKGSLAVSLEAEASKRRKEQGLGREFGAESGKAWTWEM